MDIKGSGADAFGSVKLSGKLQSGAFIASRLKYTIALKKLTLFDQLKSLGFGNATVVNVSIVMDVGLTLGDANFLVKRPVKYSAKAGLHGTPFSTRRTRRSQRTQRTDFLTTKGTKSTKERTKNRFL